MVDQYGIGDMAQEDRMEQKSKQPKAYTTFQLRFLRANQERRKQRAANRAKRKSIPSYSGRKSIMDFDEF